MPNWTDDNGESHFDCRRPLCCGNDAKGNSRDPKLQNIPPPKTEIGQRMVEAFKHCERWLEIDFSALEKRLMEKIKKSEEVDDDQPPR